MVFPVIGGDGKPTGYEISNSYRIDQGSAVGMARFGNNSRNGTTFTMSFWIKRTKLGEFQTIITSKVEDSGVNSFLMTFQADDTFKVQGQPASGTGAGANVDHFHSSAVFRDVSAWYHIVYRQDSTLSTGSNRHRVYVNGTQIANANSVPLDQNIAYAYFYNAGSYPYAIGNDERDNDYGNFYIAEHHYTDGVSNGPDAFGETNDNGVWIPKEYTGSHGSYGHYLKFENASGGSGTTSVGGHDYTTGSSSTIGADSSGNDNHFHVQGYSAEDNTTDTPTNNFATMNPVHVSSYGSAALPTFSEGNLKIGMNSDSSTSSTIAPSKGKWYVEYKQGENTADNGGYPIVGISATLGGTAGDVIGFRTPDSTNYRGQLGTTSVNNAFGSARSANDIFGFYINLDDDILIVHKNGSDYMGSGASSGLDWSGGLTTTNEQTGFYHFYVQNNQDGSPAYTDEVNFGNPTFSISSSNSDANGYGSFEYSPTLSGTNYYALCTKNLAEFG